MSDRTDLAGLLRWYPPSWRQRYGSEFLAVMEDHLAGHPPSRRFRLSIALAGVWERGRDSGLTGGPAPRRERLRAPSLLVLSAWTAFVVAGSSYAKLAEHFQTAMPVRARGEAVVAYDAVRALAVVATVLVVAGGVLAVPGLRRFLAAGGWAQVRRPVLRALGGSVIAAAALGGLVVYAHGLGTQARNGGDSAYSVAFVLTAVAIALALGLWTAAAVAIGRRLPWPVGVSLAESLLAALLAGCMALMTAATACWWWAMASSAPWFLRGTAVGSAGSAFEPRLTATVCAMFLAASTAGYGAYRIGGVWRELQAS